MATSASNTIRVGCAGWSLASRHAALFDGGGSHLARYATRLDVAEINSSFYRAHRAQTYERWAASVPRNFRFSVKVPKAVTHDARLVATGAVLDRFADEVAGLGRKLGGLLVQLPPSLVFDARVANTFFAVLRRRFAVPIACEARHASWFEARVSTLWRRHSIARVAADPPAHPRRQRPGLRGLALLALARNLAHLLQRLRGRPSGRACRCHVHPRAARPTAWCIFDNTAHGHTVEDALRLKQILGS